MFVYLNGRRTWVELQEADSGGNSGGGNENGETNTGNTNTSEAAFKRLLEKHNNDSARVAEKLFDENYHYRGQIRQLEQQVNEAKGKAPAEGSLVLSGDDAKTWQAYQALGKPEEVKQGLDERTTLQGKVAAQERESLLRGVADIAGYKPGVLSNLDRIARVEGKELAFSVRDTQVDGKPVKVAYVKEGDNELPITDYAATNWSDFMPSLAVQQVEQQQAVGIRHVTQHAGSAAVEKLTPKAMAQKALNTAYIGREGKK